MQRAPARPQRAVSELDEYLNVAPDAEDAEADELVVGAGAVLAPAPPIKTHRRPAGAAGGPPGRPPPARSASLAANTSLARPVPARAGSKQAPAGSGALNRQAPANGGKANTSSTSATSGPDHLEPPALASPSREPACGSTPSSSGGALNRNLVFAVAAAALGSSFQHGYNAGVVNAPEKLINRFINATYTARHGRAPTDGQQDLIFATIVSIFCVGGCLGALATAPVADRLGRKRGLVYNNLLVLLACPLMASARRAGSYELLILGRLLIGLNAGLNAGLAPLYLNEIAPVRLRGALGTVYQLVITVSILLSNIFGLPAMLGTRASWPLLFALPMLPALAMLLALPRCSESPKFLLIVQGRELHAQQALAWFRQTGDVQDEMDELRAERERTLLAPPMTLGQMLNSASLRKPLTVAVGVMLSQQLSGINAVLFFSTAIFKGAGLGERAAIRATLGMSAANVLTTLLSLLLVERAGRKTLHMSGLLGMALASTMLALSLGPSASYTSDASRLSLGAGQASTGFVVFCVYLFVVMFATGPGSIPWFLVGELFPSSARPLASSIAVSVNWLANFSVSLCFLPLTNVLHGYTFLLFAGLLLFFFLFTYFRVPETKGASPDEISALFRR